MLVKILLCHLLPLATLFWPGCAQHRGSLNDDLKSREQITYYDRNSDGKVDQEKHHYRGVADADWELRDDDYNGRYEKKILYGFAVTESAVDIPVPTNVHIEPKQ